MAWLVVILAILFLAAGAALAYVVGAAAVLAFFATDNVRYLGSCGCGSVPVVAVRFGWRRLPASLHRVDLADGRNIPEAVIDRWGVDWPARTIDYVRYPRRYGSFRRAEIGRK